MEMIHKFKTKAKTNLNKELFSKLKDKFQNNNLIKSRI